MNWIDCRERMPEESEYESISPGRPNFTASEQVLAWDSLYGPCVDSTRNGKWRSEMAGGYRGQVVHGIIAWMPIPEMDIEEYKL